MAVWVVWLIIAVVLGVAEIFTLTAALGLLGGAALLTSGAAAIGLTVPVQLLVFAAASTVGIVVLRPVVARRMATPRQRPFGVDALVGQQAVVLQDVSGLAGTVRIGGEEWTARALNDSVVIPVGTAVDVIQTTPRPARLRNATSTSAAAGPSPSCRATAAATTRVLARDVPEEPIGRTDMADNTGVAYIEPGKVEVQTIDFPKLELLDGPGVNPANVGRKLNHGVILTVLATNICGSDQHMVRGRTMAPANLVLGHEILGEVVEQGADVEFIEIVDLCLVPFNMTCGRCRNGKEGPAGICSEVGRTVCRARGTARVVPLGRT